MPKFNAPNIPGLHRQPTDIPRTIDGIFDNYMAAKRGERQDRRQDESDANTRADRAGVEKDRQIDSIEKRGFDTRQTTPDMWQRGTPQIGTSPDRSTVIGGPESRQGQTVGAPESRRSQEASQPFDMRSHVQAYITKRDSDRALGSRKMESDIANTEADTKKKLFDAGVRGQGGTPAFDSKAENELRDELTKLSGPFTQVRDSIGRIRAAANNPSAAGDLALIFNYMKVLDPGSTVREGEFATAQNSAGLPDRIRARYNSVINGERLEAGQRQDFVDRAEDLYGSQSNIQKQQEGEYRRLAKNRGANPENVVINRDLPARQKQQQPRAEKPIALGGPQGARLAELRAKAAGRRP